MPETSIKPCSCQHLYQDKKYGLGNRVHNITKKGQKGKQQGWRCTVCKAEK